MSLPGALAKRSGSGEDAFERCVKHYDRSFAERGLLWSIRNEKANGAAP